MKRGVPPTERNARTGEFTPPGVLRCARENKVSLLDTSAPHSDNSLLVIAPEGAWLLLLYSSVFAHHAHSASGGSGICIAFTRPEKTVGYQLAHAESLCMRERGVGEFFGFRHSLGNIQAIGQHRRNGS